MGHYEIDTVELIFLLALYRFATNSVMYVYMCFYNVNRKKLAEEIKKYNLSTKLYYDTKQELQM